MKYDSSFYQQIIHNAPFGYAHHEVIFDANGKPSDYRFLEVNDAFQRLTGLFGDNIIGKTVRAVFPDITKSAFGWIDTFAAVAKTGESIEIEQHFEPLNRWFKVQVFSTETNFFTTIFTDITAVKKEALEAESVANQTKEESNKRILNLIEAMPDMIFVMKRDGTILEIFGGNPELLIAPDVVLIGSSIKDYFDEEEFHRHIKIYEECIEKNETGLIEFELFINGKRMFFESRIKPLDNERLLTIVRDKTDQKQLLERISDGFVAFDAEMNYIFVNETGGKLLGRPPQELIGKNYWTEFPEAKGTPFANAYLNALANQETIFIEEHYEPWNRWFSNSIYPSSNGLSIIFQEITERKLTEIALKESEERYAFLANSAAELSGLSTLKEIYAFTASKINEILNGHSKVAVVEYSNHTGKWKMQHLEGVGKRITEISKLTGFDLNHLETEISAKFKEKIISGKLEEIPFDFPSLSNNKISYNVGKLIKKMLSIDKMYSIAMKHSDHLFGNITFITNQRTGKVNAELIEAFIFQVNNFVKRITAEEAMKESKENLHNFFNSSVDFLWVSDIEGNIIQVNDTFKKQLGYELSDLNGKSVSLMFTYKYRKQLQETISKTLNGKQKSCLISLQTKGGKDIPVETSVIEGKWDGKPALFGVCKDISDLKLSEKKFATAFHHSPNIIGLSDMKSGEYIEVNQTFFDIMEYKPDEIVGKKVVDLVKMEPPFRDKALEMLNEKGAVRNLETTLFSKTGKPIHVLLSADIIRINDKEYNFTTGVDITELKNAEKSRYETESRFRAYVANAPLGVFVVDQHGNYLEVNDEGCRLTGYSREELLNKTIPDIIAPEDIEAAKSHFQQVLSEGRAQGELSGLTKTGEKRFWSVVATKISDDRFIGFQEDITERKLIDQSLLAMQANLTAIVENTLDSIWSINNNYEISYINEVFATSFNAAFGVLLKQGSNLLQSLPQSIQPFWKEQYDRALAGERIVFENTVETPETFISIEVAANPIIQQGEVIGASLFGRDITERKKNERALQESEALLQSIFRSAPIGIGLMIDRVLLQVNERFCQITGYAEEEVIGKNARFLYCTQSEFERIGKEKYAQIAKHDTGTVETKWKRKNNEEIDILLSSTPIDTSDLSKGVTFTAIDITRQKRTEQAILISNQRLESFLEISRNITKTLDQENIIQMIVDNAVSIMGLKTGAVYLKDDEETIRLGATSPKLPVDFPSNARIAVLKNHPHIDKALTTGRHVIMADAFSTKLTPEEEEIVRMRNLRSNLYIPILLREKPLGILILSSPELIENFKDEDIYLLQGFANQAAYILDNINNFEELKNYANELKQQIQHRLKAESELIKLSQAVEQSPASVVITDLDGAIEYVNPKFTQITGYTLEEAKGQNPSMLKSGHQTDDFYKGLWETISKDKVWRGELLNKKKNGDYYWESVSISPLINKYGIKTHYIGIKEDVTEKKKTEDNLLEAHIISKLGTYELDLKTQMFTVSANMSEIYGFENKRQFTIDEWLLSVHPEEHALLNQVLKDALIEKRLGLEIDFRIIRVNDKIEKWIHANGKFKYNEFGEAVSLIGTSRDITDVKKYEQELIDAKEKAEESNRLKTAFLQNMSHEVRTPLNGIIGFSELINDPDLSPEERRRFTDIIIERGWQLTSIISDILTISAIETGQEELFDEKFDVNQFLNNHLEAFKKNIMAKGVQLKSNIRLSKEQSVVFGDRPKIGQILNNLFNNALKFTKEGTIELGCSLNNGMLELYVKDTGIGIAKEKQSVIFERFAQADDKIRRDFGGTGLGLSICKGFVDLMGGQIWVASEPGHGAAFHFTIPFKPAATANNIGVKELEFSLPGKKLTVLVAEDEISNYFVLEVILKKMNFNVLRAINGEEAIEICKNEAVDLVLMDIKMPVLDGYGAALLIRELRPDLYIIAQTAHAAQSETAQYKDAFDDYITKPFTREKIIRCVEKYVLKIIK